MLQTFGEGEVNTSRALWALVLREALMRMQLEAGFKGRGTSRKPREGQDLLPRQKRPRGEVWRSLEVRWEEGPSRGGRERHRGGGERS